MLTVFLAVIAIAIILGIAKAISNNKHTKASKIAFDNLPDFKADNYYLSLSSGISIGFDGQRKKICFLDMMHKPLIYDYTKILQCEVVIDGQTVLRQSTSSTIGRAVLGGILTGGVGALIGGVTGKRTQDEKINNLDLKVVVNDTANPVFKINFLNIKTQKGSAFYKMCYQKIETWHGIISVLIRQGQNDITETSARPSPSVADELKKLRELVDNGILTGDEFDKQKAKLIG